MDLNEIEGLNKVCPAVYHAALKLRSLQKLCQMHMVSIENLRPILCAVSDSENTTAKLDEEHLRRILEELFQSAVQELPGQVIRDATEQTSRLLFKLYDRDKTGFVLLRSVEAALIVLSGDTLSAKHRALFQLAVTCSGRQGIVGTSISRNGLRVLLHDLSQVPAVVQESHVFGSVELASHSCFRGVINACVGDEHFVSWLQSEPRLLLWLSALYRLSVSEDVQHGVHCHECKAFPITGLRYRCQKCLNVHLCQNCFLTERRTRKHKMSHPVLEYCTRPSWKESMASLGSSARHALLPWRFTRRAGQGKRVKAESYEETEYGVFVSEQEEEDVQDSKGLHLTTEVPPPAPLDVKVESKALQTDNPDTQPQKNASFLQKDLNITQKAMRDLQRDKWLLEKELQVWKVAAQSEHDALEDRCTELEASMKVLIQHNQHLEKELGQVRHALSERVTTSYGHDIHMLPLHNKEDTSVNQCTASASLNSYTSCTSEEDQELEKEADTKCEKGIEEKELDEEKALHHVQKERDVTLENMKETWNQVKAVEEKLLGLDKMEENKEDHPDLDRQELITDGLLVEESFQEEDLGMDKSEEDEEEALSDLVQRLQDALLQPTTTGSCSHQRKMLLQAAEEVGESIFHFVSSFQSLTLPSPDLQ